MKIWGFFLKKLGTTWVHSLALLPFWLANLASFEGLWSFRLWAGWWHIQTVPMSFQALLLMFLDLIHSSHQLGLPCIQRLRGDSLKLFLLLGIHVWLTPEPSFQSGLFKQGLRFSMAFWRRHRRSCCEIGMLDLCTRIRQLVFWVHLSVGKQLLASRMQVVAWCAPTIKTPQHMCSGFTPMFPIHHLAESLRTRGIVAGEMCHILANSQCPFGWNVTPSFWKFHVEGDFFAVSHLHS